MPGSQDADLAARAERLSLATSQQTPIAAAPPPEQPSNGRRRRREVVHQQRWEGLQCCMCVGAAPFHGDDSRGLMMHLVRAHLGQVLTAEAVAQLRTLDKAACQICAAIRARTTPYCRTCQCATPTRPLVLGDVVQDTRRQGQVPSAPQGGGTPEAEGHRAEEDMGNQEQDAPDARRAVRAVRISDASKRAAVHLHRGGLKKVPKCVASRMAVAKAEGIEGSLADDEDWGFLARYSTRLLLAPIPRGADRNSELKRRLLFWEDGRVDELVTRICGQQVEAERMRGRRSQDDDSEERRGQMAREKTAAGGIRKAMMGLVGGVASSTPAEREQWTSNLIPRSHLDGSPCPTPEEEREARECAWGGGDIARAKADMRQACRTPGRGPALPWVHLPPLTAPGPTGDRQEHLDDIMKGAGASQRRRLTRCLDELTVRWATNQLPRACRWVLNTQVLFLVKGHTPTSKEFDDNEWLSTLPENEAGGIGADSEWMTDVAETDVVDVGPEVDATTLEPPTVSAGPNVRPIQMGEFLRKWVSRRLLVLNSGDIGKVMAAMRQYGNGQSGGTEAMAIFHQQLYELWHAGALSRPLARIKVDEKNCFGMLEWPSVRKAAREGLPRHYAVASWKHQCPSHVEQTGVEPSMKNRGAEQGDVDGPLECSLTLGRVASSTTAAMHTAQRNGSLPWASSDGVAVSAAEIEYDDRQARATAWQIVPPADRRDGGGVGSIVTDPRHEVQAFGGVADYWYLDDGDILCDPRLVLSFLTTFDDENPKVGAERNRLKTKVFYMTDADTLETNATPWQLDGVRALATVATIAEVEPTLGVVTGEPEAVEEQLRQKVEVVKAMQTKVAICQDVQTEHVLNRDSLGIGRVNHILRVHGDMMLRHDTTLGGFDDARGEALDRLFPGLTPESKDQASLSESYGGLGWRRVSDIARPANLAALLQTSPLVRGMAAAAVRAGLLPAGQLEAQLESTIQRVESAYLSGLDEVERVKAEQFISNVKDAAERQWRRTLAGQTGLEAPAPYADSTYEGDREHHAGQRSRMADEETSEAGAAGRRLTVPHVQRELTRIQDCTKLRALEATLTSQGNWPQLERLRELRHPEVSHSWLSHLDSSSGAVMTPADYVINVQKRLGARILGGAIACRLCGAPLDPQLEHAETCSTAEATRGHYACVRSLVEGFRLADPGVTTEPRGLTSTQARPADIFTTAAVPGRSAALDVCIASPNAAAAQGDAAEAAFRRKLRHYRNVIPELRRAGVAFRPLIWTADARPHPASVRTLRYAAEVAASRHGGLEGRPAMLRRWKHEITVAIMRRRAAMSRAVLPGRSARAEWLLTGWSDEAATSTRRAPQLDEDADDFGSVDANAPDLDGAESLNEGAEG